MYSIGEFRDYTHDPRALAQKVLEVVYQQNEINFPINIFEILRKFNISYQFQQFEGLEGIYSPAEDKADVAAIAINAKRPFERQRFTAAHELCHHIKDQGEEYTVIEKFNDANEVFAENFAAELLMPLPYFNAKAEEHRDRNGYVSSDDALLLSLCFGTSFRSTVWRLYNLSFFEIKPDDKFFRKYKPTAKIIELGLEKQDYNILKSIIDSYTYLPVPPNHHLWQKLKNELVFHDGRIEGLSLSLEQVSEIITDLRLRGASSQYCSIENQGIIETLGHSKVYEHIVDSNITATSYELQNLHKLLYSFSPNVNLAGEFRKLPEPKYAQLIIAKSEKSSCFITKNWSHFGIKQIKYLTPIYLKKLFDFTIGLPRFTLLMMATADWREL